MKTAGKILLSKWTDPLKEVSKTAVNLCQYKILSFYHIAALSLYSVTHPLTESTGESINMTGSPLWQESLVRLFNFPCVKGKPPVAKARGSGQMFETDMSR